jgi:hypothetical protein
MRLKSFVHIVLVQVFVLGNAPIGAGQEGKQITISGSGQLTKISNQSDYNGRSRINSDVIEEKITPENTYNPSFRIRYTNNFQPNYGFQTGIAYLKAGQRYSGKVDDTTNTSVRFNSEVTLEYLRLPFKFRFNSSINEDVQSVYLSIGAGFSLDYLTDVTLSNSEKSLGSNKYKQLPNQTIDYRRLYKNVTVSFLADALLNIKLSEKLWLVTGFNMSYGLSDIENKNYDFPDKAPNELFFPASTTKFNKPDIQARQRARNTIFAIELGLKYHFDQPKE